MEKKLKIGIIGAGKVGISMGFVMIKNGLDVIAISDKDDIALKNAHFYLGEKKEILFTKKNIDVVKNTDVIFLAVQDRIIKDVVRELYDESEVLVNKIIAHTCGSSPSNILKPLDEKGAMLGVFHPLQTFPDIDSAIEVIPETYFFIEAEGKVGDILKFIAENIGKYAVMIKAEHMVLYHLSAVFVCNLLCALLYSAENIMKKIDIDLIPFFPIIKATLKNIEEKGPLFSLTGPVIRGDIETVISHLKAIENEETLKSIYKVLSLVATQMAKERGSLNKDMYEKLEKILTGKD
ncbi:MAG: DUF2520 domain-containing protein [Syntrophorhabdaceae bacterium]|nr:DUF2520 domain-containing protein [Syntrophorhabdaceae bacterium]